MFLGEQKVIWGAPALCMRPPLTTDSPLNQKGGLLDFNHEEEPLNHKEWEGGVPIHEGGLVRQEAEPLNHEGRPLNHDRGTFNHEG